MSLRAKVCRTYLRLSRISWYGRAFGARSKLGTIPPRAIIDFPIGGFSPPEGRLARGFKPPAFSRFLFQSAVKSAESFLTHQRLAGGRLVTGHFALIM